MVMSQWLKKTFIKRKLRELMVGGWDKGTLGYLLQRCLAPKSHKIQLFHVGFHVSTFAFDTNLVLGESSLFDKRKVKKSKLYLSSSPLQLNPIYCTSTIIGCTRKYFIPVITSSRSYYRIWISCLVFLQRNQSNKHDHSQIFYVRFQW